MGVKGLMIFVKRKAGLKWAPSLAVIIQASNLLEQHWSVAVFMELLAIQLCSQKGGQDLQGTN